MEKKILKKEYDKLILQTIEYQDIEDIRIMRNKYRDCFLYSGEISSAEQKQWYERYLKEPQEYLFKVSTIFNPAYAIGMSALYNFSENGKQCEFGRIVVDQERVKERGIGLKVTLLTCQIAKELGVETVVLDVYSNNLKAYKTYVKAGFKELRQEKTTEGKAIIKMILSL